MKKITLKALVVDDERDARDLLRYYLAKNPGISAVEVADSAETALIKYLDFAPDIVFLDMVMPGRDGASLIELLKKKDPECNVVIVSAYKDYALKAIENNVYDFVLKPVNLSDIRKLVDKYRLKKSNNLDGKLSKALEMYADGIKIKISSSNSHIVVDPAEVLYCEATGSYTMFHLDNGNKEIVNTYLGRIAEILPSDRFFRLSRSYVINLDKLVEVNRAESSCVLVGDGREVKLVGAQKQIRILCELEF
ncbi:LytR/AlgR family response regulator transcription factor [Gaoshiqia sediminis]|uniref:LytTR family DNA-binding domain-containing protein n=1 Tax=Gaoshiqia sediminis TaxID=2986998 RepID=A0AA41Y601_9BACT|nr:LytTR family DNA-binding domain-containing protein [Gaoshiqia sediminis]MCW0482559.1 LytTR family DNA-binding domain-containing protein [Gaoshiqia sediminis]